MSLRLGQVGPNVLAIAQAVHPQTDTPNTVKPAKELSLTTPKSNCRADRFAANHKLQGKN